MYYEMNYIIVEHIILGNGIKSSDDHTRFDPDQGIGEVVDFAKEWDQIGPGKKYRH